MPNILVVDDDAAIRTLISALLHRQGFVSEFAENGVDAIAKLRRNGYDAVILDLMMPLASGFDVIQFLSAERKAMLPRTIVLTAASERTLQDFAKDSVAAVVRKPFDIGDLLQLLSRIVNSDGHGA